MMKNTKTTHIQHNSTGAISRDPLFEDMKISIIAVSLMANVAMFVTWLATTV